MEGKIYECEVAAVGLDYLEISINGQSRRVQGSYKDNHHLLNVDGKTINTFVHATPKSVHVTFGPGESNGKVVSLHRVEGSSQTADDTLRSPLPGRIIKIMVMEGDIVEPGDPLVVVEAMKMENELSPSMAGRVKKIHVQVNKTVDQGALLVELEPLSTGEDITEAELQGVLEQDYVLPHQAGSRLNEIFQEAGVFDPRGDVGLLLQHSRNYLLGFDISSAHMERLFTSLKPNIETLEAAPEGFEKELLAFWDIYTLLGELSDSDSQREIVRLWQQKFGNLDDISIREGTADILLKLFAAYGVSSSAEGEPRDRLIALMKSRPHTTRKALLRISQVIEHGLEERRHHVAQWVDVAWKFCRTNALSGILVRLIRGEPWKSSLRTKAIEILKHVNRRAYHELYPVPVAEAHAERYDQMRRDPLAGLTEIQKQAIQDSLNVPFEETPFASLAQSLPADVVDIDELRKHYDRFKVRPLHSWRTAPFAVYEIPPKERTKENKGDRRLLEVSWVDRSFEFTRDEEGKITGCPFLEDLYIQMMEVMAVYKKFERGKEEPRFLANRPVIFALNNEEFRWWYKDDPTKMGKSSLLRIFQRVFGFGNMAASFSLRLVVDLPDPDNPAQLTRQLLRLYLEDGEVRLKVQPLQGEPARPMSEYELRQIQERAKGKLLVHERLNLLFGPENWEEIRLEDSGRDKPGEKSAVIIGEGKIDGRKVYFSATDFCVNGGTVDKAVGEKIAWLQTAAHAEAKKTGVVIPIARLWDSGGARGEDGVRALDGAGSAMREAVLGRGSNPVVDIICGPDAGMSAYVPSISEGVVIMVEGNTPGVSQALAFLTGPGVAQTVLNRQFTATELGGADTHTRETGYADVSRRNEEDALAWQKGFLRYLLGLDFRISPNPDEQDPVYQMVSSVVDPASLIHIKAHYGRIFSGFARIGGRNVGIMSTGTNRYEELTYQDLREMVDFIRTCRNYRIPVICDQPSPWLLGDQTGSNGTLARWRDRLEQTLHDVRVEGRVGQYAVLYPGRDRFPEGDVNASADFRVVVLPEGASREVYGKAHAYGDFVVASEQEAFERIGQIEALFHSAETFATEDSHDHARPTQELLDWAIPDRPGEPFDVRKLIQGGREFEVTKFTSDDSPSSIQELFERMTERPPPGDLQIFETQKEAEAAGWHQVDSSGAFSYEYQSYRFEDDSGQSRVAVRFKRCIDDAHAPVSGVFDQGTSFVEFCEGFGRSVVAGWKLLGGKLVGVIANQPAVSAAVADKDSSEKLERFIRLCEKYKIPIARLVTMPGFQPGDEEIIDIGGMMLIAEVEFPHAMVTAVVGVNTGGGYIAYGSKFIRGHLLKLQKFLAANYNISLPTGQIMVMGAEGAIVVVRPYKTMVENAPRDQLDMIKKRAKAQYIRDVGRPEVAREAGSLDEIADFAEARARMIYGLAQSEGRVQRIEDIKDLERIAGELLPILARHMGGDSGSLRDLLSSLEDPDKLMAALTLIQSLLEGGAARP